MKNLISAGSALLTDIADAEKIEVRYHNGQQIGCIVLDNHVIINRELTRKEQNRVLHDLEYDYIAHALIAEAEKLQREQEAPEKVVGGVLAGAEVS